MLLQSCDFVAALRAAERGAQLLTLEKWSEEMARALFERFMVEEEGDVEWRGVYGAVGGHAQHLRRLSELLKEERRELELRKMKEEGFEAGFWHEDVMNP